MDPRTLLRAQRRARAIAMAPLEAVGGAVAVGALKAARALDVDRTSALFGRVTRRIGPYLREDKIGRDNLRAAFPDKSYAEIESILAGVWDNLGRVAAEFAQLDRVGTLDDGQGGRVTFDPRSRELFEKLRDDGKPALIFAAHLSNWELPALAAAAHGLDTAVLYRPPGLAAVNRVVQRIRAVNMGEMVAARRDAPLRLAQALRDGRHVAMLVDQFFTGGVLVDFFGRPARTNPLLARLLRQINCPVHGTRIVRLPNNHFRVQLTEEIPPVRDAAGAIDIQGTMQAVTHIIEGWVRENPEQWLWLHRRWRNY